MAMTGEDLRDGLQLDLVGVRIGPFLAWWWPPGLLLDLRFQGDLSSVTATLMVGYHRRSAASGEAGIKTFLVGSLSNVLLLFGIVMFFGLAGTTSYQAVRLTLQTDADPALLLVMVALVVVGLTFKIGAVPAHSWLPDAAQGAPAPGRRS